MSRLRKEHGAFAERNSAYDLETGRGLQRTGLPDIEACFRERYIAIEAKRGYSEWSAWRRDKSKQSPGQKKCIADIRAAGGVAFCTYLWDDIEYVLEKIREGWDSTAINEAVDDRQREHRPVPVRKPRNSRPKAAV